MSFILEALRKSEAERRAAPTTRGANAGVYVVTQPSRRHLGALVVPTVALAAGIGVAIGWHALTSEARNDAPSSVSSPIAQTAGDEGSSAAVPAGPGKVAPVAPDTPATLVTPTEPAASRKAAEPTMPAAVAVVRPPVKTVVAASASDAKQGVVVAGGAKPVVAPRSAQPTPTISAPAIGAQSGPAQVMAAAPTMPAAAPATAVAPAVTEELPKLTISGFANSDDTRARFAVIDNRIVREGESFAPDLRLVQVGDDGIVVEYKGRRYRP